MPTVQCVKRLQKELRTMTKEPPANVDARPDDGNLCHWYYVLDGPTGTPYEGGVYFGLLTFPDDYPFRPPSIKMFTPSGRFKTDTRLCFSMSDFHPDEWNPLWNVGTILSGLLSFMLESATTYGSITTSDEVKTDLAAASHAFNVSRSEFRKYFPKQAEAARLHIASVKAAQEAAAEVQRDESTASASLVSAAGPEDVVAADDDGLVVLRNPTARVMALVVRACVGATVLWRVVVALLLSLCAAQFWR